MSESKSDTPLTKFIDGIKKTTDEIKEETRKTTEHVKSKLEDAFEDVDRTLTFGSKKKNGGDINSGKRIITTSAPAVLSGRLMSSDVSDKESDDVGGAENITIKASNGQHESPSSTAADNTKSSGMIFMELLVITTISISAVYHTWLHRLDIAANQIPFIVAAHWALLTYLIGSSSTSEKCLVVSIDDNDDITVYEEGTSNHQDGVEEAIKSSSSFTKEQEQMTESKTKQLIRRIPLGRRHYAKVKSAYLNSTNKKYNRQEESPIAEFFTNLKPASDKSTTKNSPISWGMMNQLLKNPDFGRRKSQVGEIDMTESGMKESCLQVQEELSDIAELEEEEGEEEEANYEMGTAPLVNMRASKLERKFDYVVPMCKFRGMDFFVGDFPEKEMWKQPLLVKNGLRDKPTMIGNMMMPRGNLASYLQLPDWFDDWDNIPEETEDDPPDVKAFKRFFKGDDEYQRRRAKCIPMVVAAPYVVKLIAPEPSAMTMHSPNHPITIKKVNKVVDPKTGKTTAAAVMEVGVDFYTSAAIGRIINIVMPHLKSITIDVAFVIEKPVDAVGEEANEPSACLGVWRIDKVDFVNFAQLPEKPIEDVEAEIKDIMESFALERQATMAMLAAKGK